MKKLIAFLCLAVLCLPMANAANKLNSEGVLVDSSTGAMVLALYGFTTGTPHTNSHGYLIDDTGALVVTGIGGGTGDALVASSLAQFAATTSAQLAGVLSNETGSGLAMFGTSPAMLGTPDASGATQFKLPVAAGFASLASGEIGWDSTQVWPHLWASAPAGASDLKVFMQQSSEVDAASFRSGSTTCGIQEAINAMPFASTEGGVVHVHGVCNTATQITIRATSGGADTVSLVGDGPNGTIINYSGTGTTGVIKIGGAGYVTRNVTVSGINISCNGALACIGINAIRTKNLTIDRILYDNNGAVAAANTSACLVLDGGTGDFTAFAHVSNNRCLNGWKDGFRQIGTGANEASSNNNLYENNEFVQLNTPAVGIAYDWQTGSANTIVGGDVQGYATGAHITGRGNVIGGYFEANTTAVNFDNSVFSAAEGNMMLGYCPPTCTVTDTGLHNIRLDPNKFITPPTTLATGTSVSLIAPRQYYVCTSTCTVTPPVPAAGYEFCVLNTNNVATVITMAAIGTSARYENTARTAYGTAGTGTFISGGAVGDKVCLLGLDATHYLTVSYNGTWTAN